MTLEEIDYRTLYDSEVHKNLELLDRIKELEEGIRKHKYNIWGKQRVGHESDEELYKLIKG